MSQQSVFVLRKNVLEPCIDMYPLQEWEAMVARIKAQLNLFDPEHVVFWREFHRGTQEVELDANGRVLLPKRMLDEVGIDKELVLAAQDAMIQVWEAGAYGQVAVDGVELGRMATRIFKSKI